MYKYNLLHVAFILCMSLCGVFSIMEEIPMPPALKGCLKKETKKNSIIEVPTEPINTLCEDSFLMQNTRTTVKFEPSQKDIDVVNSILKRFLVKQRRLKRQIGEVRWRLRRPKRKEIRRLTRSEWKRLTSAFQVIKRTT
ncbi:hypothetical protein KUTeg_018820 [Tegillarca granosa]|uniref:Uncharacterized protein n=1 Tax=Tegillarca granosa TaxID=220873 RepID=A0ABQ9EAN9_TEGGR|nr:hypothetical protein KUTeg_018820 [Tegillarca granosa]